MATQVEAEQVTAKVTLSSAFTIGALKELSVLISGRKKPSRMNKLEYAAIVSEDFMKFAKFKVSDACGGADGGGGGAAEGGGNDGDADDSGNDGDEQDDAAAGGDDEGDSSDNDDSFKITVKRIDQNRSFELNVCDSDTITMVKAQIQGKEGIPSRHQRLIYGGRQLKDSYDTLGDYNIPKVGATIQMLVRARGGVKRTVKEVFTQREKTVNLVKKLSFVEREPRVGEIDNILEGLAKCQQLLEDLNKDIEPAEATFIRQRLHDMPAESLQAIIDLGHIKGEQSMKLVVTLMWPEVVVARECIKGISALYNAIQAKFTACYACYYVDAETYTDRAVMDHQSFIQDVGSKLDLKRKDIHNAQVNEAVAKQVLEMQAKMQEQATSMARTMAEQLLNEHLARNASTETKDVDM